jgi:hypothetical protein
MNLTADLLGYFRIGVSLIGIGRIGGAYGVGQWTSVQARLQSFTSSHGRQDELSGVAAGGLQLLLDNDDSAFDPDNTASPYYPNVKIMRQARITASFPPDAIKPMVYGLGYGFVEEYAARPLPLGADVLISATDLFKRLDSVRVNVTFPAQQADARINAVLDLISWPAGQRQIDTTTLSVPAITLNFQSRTDSLLQHLDGLVKAERGIFYIDGYGNAVYRANSSSLTNHSRLTKASRGTFGAGGLPVRSVISAFNDRGLYNDIHVKRSGGVDQQAQDATSQNTYDVRTYVLPTVAAENLPSDTMANSLANWILGQFKDPVQRVRAIELDGTADDNLWPHILGAEIGDRITLTHDLPGTKGIVAQDYFIESIRHTWSVTGNPEHLCVWGVTKAQPLNAYMIIDGVGLLSVAGIIGTSKLGY